MVKVVGGTSVFIETSIDTEFKMTAAQLEAAITPKQKQYYTAHLVTLPVVTIPAKNWKRSQMLWLNILILPLSLMRSMNILIMKESIQVLQNSLRYMNKQQ